MARIPEPTLVDRLLTHFRSLVRNEFPALTFFGIYEYSIQNVSPDGTTADASPTDTSYGLPGIVKIPLRNSVMGESVTLSSSQLGTTCLVMFVNGDPTRPALLSITPIASGGPATIVLAGGSQGAARVGDTISITPTQFAAALPVAGMTAVTTTNTMQGTLTSGSSKVKIG